MGFTEQAALAVTSTFQDKVEVAMIKVALMIQGEARTTKTRAQWRKRGDLAKAVTDDPGAWKVNFSWATVTNAAITGASTDADIEFQVTSEWDDLAGVLGEDL